MEGLAAAALVIAILTYFEMNKLRKRVDRQQAQMEKICRETGRADLLEPDFPEGVLDRARQLKEEGKAAVEILPGTVIHIPAGVKHCPIVYKKIVRPLLQSGGDIRKDLRIRAKQLKGNGPLPGIYLQKLLGIAVSVFSHIPSGSRCSPVPPSRS